MPRRTTPTWRKRFMCEAPSARRASIRRAYSTRGSVVGFSIETFEECKSGILSASVDAKRAHPPVEMTAIDAHQFRCARDVAVGFVEFPLNELAMIRVAGFLERRKAVGRSRWFCAAERRQVFDADAMVRVHDHYPFDGVT